MKIEHHNKYKLQQTPDSNSTRLMHTKPPVNKNQHKPQQLHDLKSTRLRYTIQNSPQT